MIFSQRIRISLCSLIGLAIGGCLHLSPAGAQTISEPEQAAAAPVQDIAPDIEPETPDIELETTEIEPETPDIELETNEAVSESFKLDLVPYDFGKNPSLLESDQPDSRAQQVTSTELPVRIILRLRERRVFVLEGEQAVASYPVAIGKPGWETPQGEFEVLQKIPDPVWKHPWNGNLIQPGPGNPLGRRWIGFARQETSLIGFHGTIDESLIGQAVSHGCVRMKNSDVEELFNRIQVGTSVTVEP